MLPFHALQMRTPGGGGGPAVPIGNWAAVRSSALGSDSSGWNGYTLRQRVLAGGLTDDTASFLRLTFEAPPGSSLTFSDARIQIEDGGSPFNYAATPLPITFSGVGNVTIPAGTQVVCDPIPVAYSGTDGFVVAAYITGTGTIRYGAVSNAKIKYTNSNDVAAMSLAAGYTDWDGGADRDIIALWEDSD